MWWGLKTATFAGIADAVKKMGEQGKSPRVIIITGFPMGGGVST